MVKAVLTTKVNPTYDDLPEAHYHFPDTYWAIEGAVGDWIVYYEPRRISENRSRTGGRLAYFATARITSIERDRVKPGHFYAFVSDYLEFDRAVPFKESDHYYETGLQREDGKTNKGAFGRSVRPISDREYDLILQAGFASLLEQNNDSIGRGPMSEIAEEPAIFERPMVQQMVARPFRDAAFSSQVKRAYANTCAVTGLKLINGGGKAEVQAAHIRPVAAKGPDSVRNGIALSGTIHWMFDRGLISIDDDYTILMARDQVPDTITRLMNVDGRLRLPPNHESSPHHQFLRYHREEVFKG